MVMQFEVVIIGGGPGGATAAILLARAGWSVAVVEKVSFPRRKVCGEYISATNLPLLRQLGLSETFEERAGPEIRQVGIFARDTILLTDMPRPREGSGGWGRALGREQLDTLLLARAAEAGAMVLQPWSATALTRTGNGYVCRITAKNTAEERDLEARVVIAAHGSWEPGTLPTQPAHQSARASDLLGFKAHFRESALPAGLMPLLVFPGGYGGMVHSDGGRVSLSCCIRRDQLERCRRRKPDASAAEAVLAHIEANCLGVRQALAGAQLEGKWLAVGPIRPGIRARYSDGIFLVGNAAGEAHPVIAEGITIAMQSAWLVAARLTARRREVLAGESLDKLGRDYSTAWRRSFAPRLHASSALAHWAMRPAAVALVLPVLRRLPSVLAWGARWSGKATEVVVTGTPATP